MASQWSDFLSWAKIVQTTNLSHFFQKYIHNFCDFDHRSFKHDCQLDEIPRNLTRDVFSKILMAFVIFECEICAFMCFCFYRCCTNIMLRLNFRSQKRWISILSFSEVRPVIILYQINGNDLSDKIIWDYWSKIEAALDEKPLSITTCAQIMVSF